MIGIHGDTLYFSVLAFGYLFCVNCICTVAVVVRLVFDIQIRRQCQNNVPTAIWLLRGALLTPLV